MKKFFASISFLCYFAVTTGVVISSHYCMNSLASVHLFDTSSKECGVCGMETHESNGCCKDEVKVLKVEQDQNTVVVNDFYFPAIEPLVSVPSTYLAASVYNFTENRHYNNHSPPLLSANDLYLQINVFRI